MWAQQPEFIATTLMWIVGILIALYSRETRRLVELPLKRWRDFRRPASAARIETLELRISFAKRIHGNAYELALFVLTAVLKFVNSYLRSVAYLFIPAVALELYSKGKWFRARDILWPLLVGALSGMIASLNVVANDLRRFPESVEQYEEEALRPAAVHQILPLPYQLLP